MFICTYACVSLSVYIYVAGVRFLTAVVSAVLCCRPRSSACHAALSTQILPTCFDQSFSSNGKKVVPPCPRRFIFRPLMPATLLLGPLLFLVSSSLPATALDRLQATTVNGLPVNSKVFFHTASHAACTLKDKCPSLLVEGPCQWMIPVNSVSGAFVRCCTSQTALAQPQQANFPRHFLQSWFAAHTRTLPVLRGLRKWMEQRPDATATIFHTTLWRHAGKRRRILQQSSASGREVHPSLLPLSVFTFNPSKFADFTAWRVPACSPRNLRCGTSPRSFHANMRRWAGDTVSGASLNDEKLSRVEGRVSLSGLLGIRDGDVLTGRYAPLYVTFFPAKLFNSRETLARVGFVHALQPGSLQLVKSLIFSLAERRRRSERSSRSRSTQGSLSTRLHMARSRSKPIHREAHPGLKQLILREKFWMRFDPAKNKLIHTPEYAELLLRDSQQLTPRPWSKEQQVHRHKQESAAGRAEAEGQLELSEEQRAALQAREVAYRRQQPRFRARRWGSGRWKKEEAYVLRLLASHRQKVLQHELQKVRRRREAAERLRKLEEGSALAVIPEASTGGAGERPYTQANNSGEDGDAEQQAASVENRVASLSYSFILKEVMPRLAALEQAHLQQALGQWKRYERQRELQQCLRTQQQAQRRGEAEDAVGGATTRVSEGLELRGPLSLLGHLQDIPQKKKMLMQRSSQVVSLPEQQQLFLGHFETLSKNLSARRQCGQDVPKGREQLQVLRRISVSTREVYLQFLADVHHVFTSFEEMLTDGVEALLRQPPRQEMTAHLLGDKGDSLPSKAQVDTPRAGTLSEGVSPLPVIGESVQGGREISGTAARPHEWLNPQSLEEFVSCLSFQRGTKSGDDLVAICELLKRSPPSPSSFIKAFLLDIEELQRRDFLRALSRIYHFHKEWHVAGRWFLGWLTRRQQLLPKRLKMTMWDADTDSLELGIDILSLSWSSAEKNVFLGELAHATKAAEAALTKPLLESIEAAHTAAVRGG